MINNSPQSPSRISQGLKKLNNFRYNALNKLSTSSSGQEQPKNKSSTKQVSFSPARPSSKKEPGITNSIQFNRIGMNTQALQTLSNAALHVKNLLSDMLENADPEDKKVFDIDEELKFKLDDLSKKRGMKTNELIRFILSEYLLKEGKK